MDQPDILIFESEICVPWADNSITGYNACRLCNTIFERHGRRCLDPNLETGSSKRITSVTPLFVELENGKWKQYTTKLGDMFSYKIFRDVGPIDVVGMLLFNPPHPKLIKAGGLFGNEETLMRIEHVHKRIGCADVCILAYGLNEGIKLTRHKIYDEGCSKCGLCCEKAPGWCTVAPKLIGPLADSGKLIYPSAYQDNSSDSEESVGSLSSAEQDE